MAAGDLFKKAARYRKQHPGMSMPEAVKHCSKAGKKKPAAVSGHKKHHKPRKAVKKRSTAKRAAPKKVKTKVKIRKVKNGFSLGISGVSMAKIHQELTHQRSLTGALEKHRTMLKQKGLRPAEKQQIRRDIAHYRNAIAASKKHISALKRSI